jgi:hypothetical protein
MNLNLPNNKGYSGGEGRASGYASWLNKPWRGVRTGLCELRFDGRGSRRAWGGAGKPSGG